jgi:hypothetical protein
LHNSEQGTLVWGGNFDGTFTFTPNPAFSGTIIVPYQVEDPQGLNSTAEIRITISRLDLLLSGIQLVNVNCGTLGSITIPEPTSGGTAPYEYSLNNVDFQTSNIFSNLAAGSYIVYVKDANNCNASTPVTIANDCPGYLITGIVYNDVDGLTDNDVDGAVYNAGGLSAILVNSSGNVLAISPVSAIGAFSFNGVLDGAYTIQLSTSTPTIGQPAPLVTLPTGWVTTGEYLGTGVGSDGTANSALSIVVSGANVENDKFGIQQVPIAGNGANSAKNPGGTLQVEVPANTFTNGDGTTVNPSSDFVPGVVAAIHITAFPTGATSIVINEVTYTSDGSGVSTIWPSGGLTVPTDGNGNPTQIISVDPTNNGFTQIIIPFVSIDNGGFESGNIGQAVLNLTPYPDLTPTIDLPSNTFIQDQVKNVVLVIEEVNNFPTAPGITVFSLSAPLGYAIQPYNSSLLNMTPSGGSVNLSVNNTEFEVILSSPTLMVFKAKAGVMIGARSFKSIGIELKRTTALGGATSNITVNITTDPTRSYDSNDFNNIFSRILNAQR